MPKQLEAGLGSREAVTAAAAAATAAKVEVVATAAGKKSCVVVGSGAYRGRAAF